MVRLTWDDDFTIKRNVRVQRPVDTVRRSNPRLFFDCTDIEISRITENNSTDTTLATGGIRRRYMASDCLLRMAKQKQPVSVSMVLHNSIGNQIQDFGANFGVEFHGKVPRGL